GGPSLPHHSWPCGGAPKQSGNAWSKAPDHDAYTLDRGCGKITQPVIDTLEFARNLSEEIVLEDVIQLSAGEQVPSDAIVLDGFAEANEAMLTGESDL
ncbi:hypothetical protein PZH43_14775, partial [Streptococcus gordonii]|nr:hypothetical protein [Streptococcus gordonii]